ncbi:MAG: hypothetical protein K6G18_13285 [Treponema sp.]|nr:hypothetical protein [Treponema sp.]
MTKTKILSVLLASLACVALLGSCDYWKEDYYKNGGDSGNQASGGSGTASGASGAWTSELRYWAYTAGADPVSHAAFENEFGAGAELNFACDGKLFDGNPHQGRVRAYNYDQRTVLKEGTFQGTWKDQFTFTLNGTAYVGKFRLQSGKSGDSRSDWDMDIYDSNGTTLLCTADCLSTDTGNLGSVWTTERWR